MLEGIREAGKKIGRAPSWSELRRISGIPESRVRVYFGSLAEAVRAAGLQPGRAGLKIATEDLLEDFAQVAAKLGRSPSRNEYVREGKYSAGAFYARFGSWPGVKQAIGNWQLANGQSGLTTEGEEKSGDRVIGGSGDLTAGEWVKGCNSDSAPYEAHEGDKAIAMQWARAMTALPGDLTGKRRVTDAVCAMIVNTLMGEEAGSRWERAVRGEIHVCGENCEDCHDCQNCQNCQTLKVEESSQQSAVENGTQHSAVSIQSLNSIARIGTSQLGQAVERVKSEHAAGLARVNGCITSGGLLDPERPVMGPPFFNLALMNAPVNELGVVFLFGMVAGELGFQIEAVQGKYPDIYAKRQIQPGRWQWVRIEVEYESRNFALHGHDAEKCDMIVCWRHNWVKCPKHIEVIELSRIMRARGIAT